MAAFMVMISLWDDAIYLVRLESVILSNSLGVTSSNGKGPKEIPLTFQ